MHIEAATRSQILARAPFVQHTPEPSAHTLFGSVELTGARMSFAKDVEIYGENEPADYVYKVLSGSVRVYKILQDGRRQIEGFYFPGDVFGMEIGSHHASSAEAVSASTIAVVRRSALLAAAGKDADVSNRLWTHTARELEQARRHAMLLVKTAQERVASFLIDISNRLAGEAVELPMSRQDIADYLGLTIETVSRTLTQFQQTSAIELATSRRMILRNRQALINLDS
ncbi:MAG: helix-turn-helix domain-containing protein [Pseudorhodoplanes sp.]|uniref:helix-turn-helix domain-containing protein n=1 Tax=Pseudorhodoplanes sp. TaxID=1934341 RepID=UPI003D0E8464